MRRRSLPLGVPLIAATAWFVAAAGAQSIPGAAAGSPTGPQPATAVPDGAPGDAALERGRYLATAGNCFTCHTRPGGEPFAGGLPFDTPFGTLYSTNITPDAETGIGAWTRDDFEAALRRGLRPDGSHLYPAFPYTAFTKLTDADVDALYDYFSTVRPVRYRPPENAIRFPADRRWLLGFWKRLYFREGRFVPDASRPTDWNRGAYLVESLGHCSACHTPRNAFGAEIAARAYAGGRHAHSSGGRTLYWYASNLTPSRTGLGAWSAGQIAEYLATGQSERAGVFGPMNEVVVNSTRHLARSDLEAMATYLRSLPPIEGEPGAAPDAATMQAGEVLYSIHCGTCHLPTGLGSESTGPPLVGSAVTLADGPESLINVTLHGPELPPTSPSPEWQARRWQMMEAYDGKLSDEQAAQLLTYVRNAWGNRASAVTPDQVAAQR